MDAFSVDWAGENNWLMPPIYLNSRAIFHLEVCGARGVLVIRKWLSAAFSWPTVFSMGGLRPSVRQVVEFSDPSFVFAPVRDDHNTIFCPFRFKSAVLASLLDGSSLVFHTSLHLPPSVPARQHFCQSFIALFVVREVRTSASLCLQLKKL